MAGTERFLVEFNFLRPVEFAFLAVWSLCFSVSSSFILSSSFFSFFLYLGGEEEEEEEEEGERAGF